MSKVSVEISLVYDEDLIKGVPVGMSWGFALMHVPQLDVKNKRKKRRAICFRTEKQLEALERYIQRQRLFLKSLEEKEAQGE